ncbi:MAG: ACP S-malonyltransferase [Lachnospiraceae bacterium]|jgi:[acyl-carrier-protein] S-malonyltransferase|nr:ACP S-malonyltransferase [Lachnospiraceae bacterium]
MGKIAFLFPGQGAQYTGMGKEFYEKEKTAAGVFDTASKVTGLNLPALCFEENGDLNQTQYTQIAMLTDELAILSVLKEHGIRPAVTAGLSLGEYGAIVASGIMRMEDAFRVVRERGIYMQEAVPVGGAMSAVLGLAADVVERVCEETEGTVTVANYNCPGQLVISGEAAAVEKAGAALKELGAKRVVPLKVSGPFHSKMLIPAGEKLERVLEDVELSDFTIPYVSNLMGDYVRDTKEIKFLLKMQISSPVKWQQSVEKMIEEGVDTFVEIGPGRTLSGFMKKINKEVKVLNIDKYEDLEKALDELKGEVAADA